MSYCRWSSDDHLCDVYVYEGSHGWQTHVATNRPIFADPLPPAVVLADDNFDAWCARKRVVDQMLLSAERVLIDLPHDGADFTDDTPQECADTLLTLRAAGYNVPQYAIDSLREESLPTPYSAC